MKTKIIWLQNIIGAAGHVYKEANILGIKAENMAFIAMWLISNKNFITSVFLNRKFLLGTTFSGDWKQVPWKKSLYQVSVDFDNLSF